MQGNVLMTACGAKVPLLRAWRRAARERGMRVLVSDLSPLAPARDEADGVVELPAWHDAGYAAALRAACADHHVRLVVPTADGELPSIAALREELAAQNVRVLAPPPAILGVCRDKRAFADFCAAHGFPIPHTYADHEVPDDFPVFVRPATGQGGVGAMRITSARQLDVICSPRSAWLVQPLCTDPEYSVDLLMDLDGGSALQAVARRRLRTYGGEAQVSRVERIDALTGLAMRLGEALGLVGHNVIQAFHSDAHGPRLIEVNLRFGGASTLSIHAGLASPERLLDLLAGDLQARQPHPIRYGLTLLRHAEDRFLEPDATA